MSFIGILAVVFLIISILIIKNFYYTKSILLHANKRLEKKHYFSFGVGILFIILAFIFGAIEFMIQVI